MPFVRSWFLVFRVLKSDRREYVCISLAAATVENVQGDDETRGDRECESE